jgi:hypothetical protein
MAGSSSLWKQMAEPPQLTTIQEHNFVDFVNETVSQYLLDGSYEERLVNEVAQTVFKTFGRVAVEEIGLRVLDCYVWHTVEKMGKSGNWRSLFSCSGWNQETGFKKISDKIAHNLKQNIFFDLGFSFNSETLRELSEIALSRHILGNTVKTSPLNGIWKEKVSCAMEIYNRINSLVEQSVQLIFGGNVSKKIDLITSDLENTGICVDEHVEAMILDYYFAEIVKEYLSKGTLSNTKEWTECVTYIEAKLPHDFSWVFPSDQIEWLLRWAVTRYRSEQTVPQNPMDYSELLLWIEEAKKSW